MNVNSNLVYTPSFIKRSNAFKAEFQKFINPLNNKYFNQNIQAIQQLYTNKDVNKIHIFLKWVSDALNKGFKEFNSYYDNLNFMSHYRGDEVKFLHKTLGYGMLCLFKNYNTTCAIIMNRLMFLTNELTGLNYDVNNYKGCKEAFQSLIIKLYQSGYTKFDDLKLMNLDFRGIQFNNCNFYNSRFDGTNLENTEFLNSNLSRCSLNVTNAHGCIIKDCYTNQAKFGFRKIYKQFTIINPKDDNWWVDEGINNLVEPNKDDVYYFTNTITNNELIMLQNIFAQNNEFYLCPNGVQINLICPITLEHNIKTSCVVEYPISSGTRRLVNIYNADSLWAAIAKNPKKCPLHVPFKNLRFLTPKQILEIIHHE